MGAFSSKPAVEITNTIRRSPDGSMKGDIILGSGGYVTIDYDGPNNIFYVKTVSGGQTGDGRRLMEQVFNLATQVGAAQLATYTSRPGYFKSFGFKYTAAQIRANERYTPEQLEAEEQNRSNKGGGFDMIKHPPFA